jgi:hypothetical protein
MRANPSQTQEYEVFRPLGFKLRCLPGHSHTFRLTLAFVIVAKLVVDRSEKEEDFLLLASSDVFLQCGGHGFSLCPVPARFPHLFVRLTAATADCNGHLDTEDNLITRCWKGDQELH